MFHGYLPMILDGLRVTLSAAHADEDVDALVAALTK